MNPPKRAMANVATVAGCSIAVWLISVALIVGASTIKGIMSETFIRGDPGILFSLSC